MTTFFKIPKALLIQAFHHDAVANAFRRHASGRPPAKPPLAKLTFNQLRILLAFQHLAFTNAGNYQDNDEGGSRIKHIPLSPRARQAWNLPDNATAPAFVATKHDFQAAFTGSDTPTSPTKAAESTIRTIWEKQLDNLAAKPFELVYWAEHTSYASEHHLDNARIVNSNLFTTRRQVPHSNRQRQTDDEHRRLFAPSPLLQTAMTSNRTNEGGYAQVRSDINALLAQLNVKRNTASYTPLLAYLLFIGTPTHATMDLNTLHDKLGTSTKKRDDDTHRAKLEQRLQELHAIGLFTDPPTLHRADDGTWTIHGLQTATIRTPPKKTAQDPRDNATNETNATKPEE